METKKIKEIKRYAKADVKYFVRRLGEVKKYGKEAVKEFDKRYPEGITTYYKEICQQHEDRKGRLVSQFGYTPEMLKERVEIYHEAFWGSWQWWNNKLVEIKEVMAKYKPIFKEAEELAKKVDVSDIKDGFPCGMSILYLEPEMKNSDLGKALSLMSESVSSSHWAKYQLPIKIPSYGQCMSFDERICGKVAEFLTSKGVKTAVYSMID